MICFKYPVFCFFNIKAVREFIEGIVRESECTSTFVSKGLLNLLKVDRQEESWRQYANSKLQCIIKMHKTF